MNFISLFFCEVIDQSKFTKTRNFCSVIIWHKLVLIGLLAGQAGNDPPLITVLKSSWSFHWLPVILVDKANNRHRWNQLLFRRLPPRVKIRQHCPRPADCVHKSHQSGRQHPAKIYFAALPSRLTGIPRRISFSKTSMGPFGISR